MLMIETERVYLREWVPDDWKRYKPLATDEQIQSRIASAWANVWIKDLKRH